ncbi:MAG: cytochrome C [Desulfuromonadales bacterium]|nr:cytochrome C [Desulfuromonadales bacterium]
MKKIILLFSIVVLCAATAAIAVPANRSLTFDKGALGAVEFSGKIHAEAGFKCGDCHNPNLFPKYKQGSVEITMEKIYAGELCGFCHNGETAFEAKTSCNRCHVK